MSDRKFDVDSFARGIQQILDEVDSTTERVVVDGVTKGAKEAAKEWSRRAPRRTGAYAKSIKSRVDAIGAKPEAHAYSTKPGLPHLLEFGHATMGGGATRAYPHVADAAEHGFDVTINTIEDGIDKL